MWCASGSGALAEEFVEVVVSDAVAALERAVRLLGETGKVAARGLAWNGSEEAVAALVRLSQDPDAKVRGRVMEPLGRVAQASPAAAAALRATLGDAEESVRSEGAKALAQTGDAALPDLLSALKDPQCTFVSAGQLGSAFAAIGVQALEPLQELLQSEDDALRAKAALALCATAVNDGSCTPELARVLGGEDRQAAMVAMATLGRLGVRAHQAVGPLRAMPKFEEEDLARQVQDTLQQIGQEVEGVDFRFAAKPVGAGLSAEWVRFQWDLVVDGATFFLAYLDVEKKTPRPERCGLDAGQLGVRWVVPGAFLEVSWGTCPQGSGRYIAYSTLLLHKTAMGWREVFRHSGEGYTRGAADDWGDRRWEFAYDDSAKTLVLREKTARVYKEESSMYVTEWPCELTGDSLTVRAGKTCEELEEPMTLKQFAETRHSDLDTLRKFNPGQDVDTPVNRVLTADAVSPFVPDGGVFFSVGN